MIYTLCLQREQIMGYDRDDAMMPPRPYNFLMKINSSFLRINSWIITLVIMAMDLYSSTPVASQNFIANKIDQPYFRPRYMYNTYNIYVCINGSILTPRVEPLYLILYTYVVCRQETQRRLLGIFPIIWRMQHPFGEK